MKKFKFNFIYVALASAALFFSCGDSDDNLGDEPGGGGNGSGKLMLPIKISNADNSALSVKEFKYDEKNRVKEVVNKVSIKSSAFDSETIENITITYDNENIKEIYAKRVITSSNLSKPNIQEEFYTVSYSNQGIELKLVKSTNDNNTDGTGASLGTVFLKLDKDKKVEERRETWANGVTANYTFTYSSDNMTKYIGSTTINGQLTKNEVSFEYDNKHNIYHAVNAPRWIEELPLAGTVDKNKNNVIKTINKDLNSGNTNIYHTIFEYNSDGYPVKYINKLDGNNEAESEWKIEYKTIN